MRKAYWTIGHSMWFPLPLSSHRQPASAPLCQGEKVSCQPGMYSTTRPMCGFPVCLCILVTVYGLPMPLVQFTYTGMLSKSRGQILRVAATMHVLFHLDTPLCIPTVISDEALKAAQDFVETSNQHVAFLAGRGDITEAIDMFKVLKEGM